MPDWLLTSLTTIIPSLVVGVCTAVISVRLSLCQFHSERWWERKADAYSRIIDALHRAAAYYSARVCDERTGEDITSENGQIRADYEKAVHELDTMTGVGAYIISDEVANSLEKLRARPRLNPEEHAWSEVFEAEYDVLKKTLAEVRELAKKDLGV
ncbi:MAG: hypothetical protein AB9869_05420 [Verrucomicrobiia bacterium]